MRPEMIFLSVAIMFSGYLGFPPGVWWAWTVSVFSTFAAAAIVLLLLLADKSKLMEHPQPEIRAAVIGVMTSIAQTNYWFIGIVNLAFVFGFTAKGRIWLAIAIAISTFSMFVLREIVSRQLQSAAVD
ncbi:hypothetical protein C1752_10468 [Acaryochloris thomasi RCC1774]|uniref:Uncharacterized protein n=1 Tax=Acaryochloris thomasi RCC1774 TaxID=1764569 RepID=A0A2W1J941_9CYAN|nr:hypothetical protein [Acaryochloris thomasi]PZD70618.1 hypothetical protein C1752_10468 [Acaryochloris thomasi RCC1774]